MAIWRKPVLTYAVSVVSLTASVNSVNSVKSLAVSLGLSADVKRRACTYRFKRYGNC